MGREHDLRGDVRAKVFKDGTDRHGRIARIGRWNVDGRSNRFTVYQSAGRLITRVVGGLYRWVEFKLDDFATIGGHVRSNLALDLGQDLAGGELHADSQRSRTVGIEPRFAFRCRFNFSERPYVCRPACVDFSGRGDRRGRSQFGPGRSDRSGELALLLALNTPWFLARSFCGHRSDCRCIRGDVDGTIA